MAQYRFVGSSLQLGDAPEITRFGSSVEVEPELATELIGRNVALLPEDLWKRTLLTDAECAEYFSTELHANASTDFIAKRNHAWRLLHDYRTSLSASAGKGE